MSNKLRNPFKMRASERIESDVSFLRLYSHIVLETLIEKNKNGELWSNILFIRSSPGAGKTSLLRVFEPTSLLTLFTHRSSQEYRDLFNSLKKVEAISDNGVEVLGVLISCTRNYEILEELNNSDGQKLRLFYALLNSRFLLSFLRSASNLLRLNFPDDLSQIKFQCAEDQFTSYGIPKSWSGQELFDWASQIERNVHYSIDSFRASTEGQIGHNELFVLDLLKSENFTANGKSICSKVLIMLDDAHKLTFKQRDSLLKYIVEKRSACNVWISERLEAFRAEDHFASFQKRDYQEINLEKFWATHHGQFEKILSLVALKRAAISTEQINAFSENLESDLEEEAYAKKLTESIASSKNNIIKLTSYSTKFDNWLNFINENEGQPFEQAILFKQVEIVVQRNKGKTQLALDFPLSVAELKEKMDGSTAAAALLFVSKESKLPFYFGFKNLAKIATNNIEQFLAFSSELFEGVLSNGIAGNQVMLSAEAQEKIIKRVAEEKWKELSKVIPQSNQVITFLTELGNFSAKETFKPNAPYAPGVTGFSVIQDSSMNLIKEEHWLKNQIHQKLVNVLSTCLAYNLLEMKEVSQGVKDKTWKVFYLNRWLCVRFNLPLTYGGWRQKKADDLLKWIQNNE